MADVDQFIAGYIEGALLFERDGDELGKLGHRATVKDFDEETLIEMSNDAAMFYDRYWKTIAAGIRAAKDDEVDLFGAGYAFYAARAGDVRATFHGFPYKEAQVLQKGSQRFPSYSLFVRDGMLHGKSGRR